MENTHHARIATGSSGPERAASIWKNSVLRRVAVAAAVSVLAWVLWPAASGEEPTEAGTPGPVPVSALEQRDKGSQEPQTAPPADGLENRLRRCYVSGFKATGSLADAAAQLIAKIRLARRKTLTARVLKAGDTPVHLNLKASIPAWTLFEMMALQTGTTMELSGQSVVFRRDRKPAPRAGMLTRSGSLPLLRTLLGLQVKNPDTDDLVLSARTLEAFDSDVQFELVSEDSAKYSGTPRDVQALDLAVNALTDRPAMASLFVELLSIPLPGPGVRRPETTALSGIFTAEQIQEKLRPLRQAGGVEFSTLHANLVRAGDETIVTAQLQNRTNPDMPAILDAKFSIPPSDLKFCRLYSEISMEQPTGENPEVFATQQMSSTTALYFGQTLGLGTFKQDASHEVLIFVTPALPGSAAAAFPR